MKKFRALVEPFQGVSSRRSINANIQRIPHKLCVTFSGKHGWPNSSYRINMAVATVPTPAPK